MDSTHLLNNNKCEKAFQCQLRAFHSVNRTAEARYESRHWETQTSGNMIHCNDTKITGSFSKCCLGDISSVSVKWKCESVSFPQTFSKCNDCNTYVLFSFKIISRAVEISISFRISVFRIERPPHGPGQAAMTKHQCWSHSAFPSQKHSPLARSTTHTHRPLGAFCQAASPVMPRRYRSFCSIYGPLC